MATLVFTAIGTAIGGPLGGAIGALVGRQVDTAILGSGSREGARLKELAVTTSSYGTPLPRHFGAMRVAGTIIWATDLSEHRETAGGGKAQPSVTTYNYTASFAVALGSRPIAAIGRIWADGNLLRGAAGDLKTGGQFRFHSGHRDQPADTLLAAAEGPDANPAYRGLAYAVFEDLQLADFGNRIPALTFEILADEGELNLAQVVDGVIGDTDASVSLGGVAGFSCEGSVAELIDQLSPVFPIDCDVSGDTLTLAMPAGPALNLQEATVTSADDGFGGESGYGRKRLPPTDNPPEIVRYYDIDRDYQPGLQRVLGRPGNGQPTTLEFPVSTVAGQAREMIEQASRRANWARQTLSWRTAQIDAAIRPGSLVRVPGQTGIWRLTEWEWRSSGVEMTLLRASPAGVTLAGGAGSDAGRPVNATDVPLSATALVAFEMPWDGTGTGDTPLVFAAASSESAGWTGAALYLDAGDGLLQLLTSSGRQRAIVGHATEALPAAAPHLFDRNHTVTIQLLDDAFALQNATARQIAGGANRALLGHEIIQFMQAVPLGGGAWRLGGLLRGRGGTEYKITSHSAGDPFVLLDGTPVALDGTVVGQSPAAAIAAIGVGDSAPAASAILCRGLTRSPLSPVRPIVSVQADGARRLRWTRRARGAWQWLDGVETPLREETEAYDVIVGDPAQPIVSWSVSACELDIPASQWAALVASHAGQPVSVRQRGSFAVSVSLLLTYLT